MRNKGKRSLSLVTASVMLLMSLGAFLGGGLIMAGRGDDVGASSVLVTNGSTLFAPHIPNATNAVLGAELQNLLDELTSRPLSRVGDTYRATSAHIRTANGGAVPVVRLFGQVNQAGPVMQFTSQQWRLVYVTFPMSGQPVLTWLMVNPYRESSFSVDTTTSGINYNWSTARANVVNDFNSVLSHFGGEGLTSWVRPEDLPGQWQGNASNTWNPSLPQSLSNLTGGALNDLIWLPSVHELSSQWGMTPAERAFSFTTSQPIAGSHTAFSWAWTRSGQLTGAPMGNPHGVNSVFNTGAAFPIRHSNENLGNVLRPALHLAFGDDVNFESTSDVMFNLGDGVTEGSVETVNNGTTITAPIPDPRHGFTFGGWYEAGDATQTPFDFTTPITRDMTFNAIWTPVIWRLIFGDMGIDITHGLTIVEAGVTIPTPTRSDRNFMYWREIGSNVAFDWTQPITSNMTFTERWGDLHQFVITFSKGFGGNVAGIETVVYGDRAPRIADPVREGHTFTGWTWNGVEFDFETNIHTDKILVAEWLEYEYNPETSTPETTVPDDSTTDGSYIGGGNGNNQGGGNGNNQGGNNNNDTSDNFFMDNLPYILMGLGGLLLLGGLTLLLLKRRDREDRAESATYLHGQ